MRSAGQVSSDLPRHVSSWTPAAYEQCRGFHEQETEKKKEEMEAAEYEEKMQELNRRVQRCPLLNAWRGGSGLSPMPPLLRPQLGRGGRGRRGARGSSPSPLLVCGCDAVCKGSALALPSLVRSVPFC